MKFSKKFICIFLLFITCVLSTCIYNYKINKKQVYLIGKMIYIEADDVTNNKNNDSDFIEATYQNSGIVTCIDKNNRFISLGHSIADGNEVIGNCYLADSYLIDKSSTNKIGTLKTFANTTNELGNITNNSYIGLIGEASGNYKLNDYELLNISSRLNVRKGKAKIYINLEGIEQKYFDIEIKDINYASESKNIDFELIDNNLIELTGGLVQGMSGSPIIQNGKIIGVFNSILEKDVCNGYAVFIDEFFK